MKTWKALWASFVTQAVSLRWKTLLLALIAFAVLTAVGCAPSGTEVGNG